jgi:hypothetical protein
MDHSLLAVSVAGRRHRDGDHPAALSILFGLGPAVPTRAVVQVSGAACGFRRRLSQGGGIAVIRQLIVRYGEMLLIQVQRPPYAVRSRRA